MRDDHGRDEQDRRDAEAERRERERIGRLRGPGDVGANHRDHDPALDDAEVEARERRPPRFNWGA